MQLSPNQFSEAKMFHLQFLQLTPNGKRPASTALASGILTAILALCFVLVVVAQPASAAVLFFTDQTAYNTALTADGLSSSSFNFNSTPSQNYSNAAGLTIDGVNFVGVPETAATR